jgi:hypothetical protein
MSKKKKIILIIFSLLLVFFLVSFGWFFYKRRIENTVLTLLQKEFKFCNILKDSVFFGKGKFWLMCNGRPFYTEYQNKKLIYDLNGWSWLKNTKYWEEISNCDFYDYRDSKLIFYCTKIAETFPYNWESAIAKIYRFNESNFEIEKESEIDFFTLLTEDVQRNFNFKNCELKKSEAFGGRGYPPGIALELNCDGRDYETETNLAFVLPPLPKENAIEAFRVIFPNATQIETKDNTISAEINSSRLSIFKWGLRIYPKSDPESTIRELQQLIFPQKDLGELKLIHEEKFEREILPAEMAGLKIRYYRIKEGIIRVYFTEKTIFGIERKIEGFYEK